MRNQIRGIDIVDFVAQKSDLVANQSKAKQPEEVDEHVGVHL